jgi:outer membrane immunogenic protein
MVAPIPVFSWTGCYIGAHVGGGTMHDSFSQDNSDRDFPFSSNQGNNGTGTGAVAGGQVGCNYQDGNAVFGLEAEGYWANLRTTSGNSFNSIDGESFFTHTRNKSDFDIAARVGIAFDRTLVYGKGGWVWGNFGFDSVETFCCTNIDTFTGQNKQLNGLLLGVGIEHALTRNWTVKLEYNFLDFGSQPVTFVETFNGRIDTTTRTTTEHASKQIVKVGFNYLFNWGAAPVLAKY